MPSEFDIAKLVADTRPTADLDVSLRGFNVLMRNGYTTIGSVAAAVVQHELADLHGLGKTSYEEVLVALEAVAAHVPKQAGQGNGSGPVAIATRPADPALQPLAALDALLESLSDRARDVFRRRVLASPGEQPTLQEIGDEIGVTRERVRQVEQQCIKKLNEMLVRAEYAQLGERLRSFHAQAKPIAWEADVDQRAVVDADETPVAEMQWRLFKHLADAQSQDGFVHWGALPELRDAVKALVAEFSGAPSDEMLGALDDELGLGRGMSERLLAEAADSFHLTPDPDTRFIIRRSASYVEFARAIIMAAGRNVSFQELASTIAQVRTCEERSLRNALVTDDAFARVSKNDWTLAFAVDEQHEYKGIVNDIEQALSSLAGGETLAIGDVVTRIVGLRGVSENSVRLYAGDARFYSPKRGRIRLRTPDDPAESVVEPATIDELLNRPNAVMLDGSPALQILVDSEMLRGSGRPTSNVVARYLNLQPGDTRAFSVLDGKLEVTLRWTGKQPTFSSLRRAALQVGANEGDMLQLRFPSRDEIDVRIERAGS